MNQGRKVLLNFILRLVAEVKYRVGIIFKLLFLHFEQICLVYINAINLLFFKPEIVVHFMGRMAELVEDPDVMDFNFCCDLAVLAFTSEAVVDASSSEVHVPDFPQGRDLI
jgi:hypothetical protein